MSDLHRILSLSSSNSLIIIDEIGVGTEAQSGFYIAREFIKKLILDTRCSVICTTHFRKLCNLNNEFKPLADDSNSPFKNQNQIFTNLHVQVAPNGHGMCFKVLPGVSNGSMGIKLAEIAGFPEEIICNSIELINRKSKSSC